MGNFQQFYLQIFFMCFRNSTYVYISLKLFHGSLMLVFPQYFCFILDSFYCYLQKSIFWIISTSILTSLLRMGCIFLLLCMSDNFALDDSVNFTLISWALFWDASKLKIIWFFWVFLCQEQESIWSLGLIVPCCWDKSLPTTPCPVNYGFFNLAAGNKNDHYEPCVSSRGCSL